MRSNSYTSNQLLGTNTEEKNKVRKEGNRKGASIIYRKPYRSNSALSLVLVFSLFL